MYQSGKLMVFSVGNRCAPDGAQGARSDASCSATPSDVKFPARYPWVIAVGASDEGDRVPAFSRCGQAMTDHGVVAPGVNIFSTDREGRYGLMSGTSASTPHVTGAIALACQLQPVSPMRRCWPLAGNSRRPHGGVWLHLSVRAAGRSRTPQCDEVGEQAHAPVEPARMATKRLMTRREVA